GPSNWARCRLTRPEDTPDTLRLVLVFDTVVETPPMPSPSLANEHYYALSPADVAAHGTFRLAAHVRDNAWFLNAPWVDEWIMALYDSYRQNRHRGRGSWRDDSPFVLEHLASYLNIVEIIRLALTPEAKAGSPVISAHSGLAVQVINPQRDLPVDVDLVLDIGNSRTTGILVETLPQRATNLNDSYALELRDMSRPEFCYSEPFETRVEFAEVTLGNDALSRRSGRRSPAFAWPSAVRTGPEAARLATHSICAEGSTGMSSPKRYLWDERPWQQSWRYNTGGHAEPMVTRGLFAKQVNREGTPLACFNDPLFTKNPVLRKQAQEPAFESLFTRSSLMMFMLGEILTQALVTINAPATRMRRELPNLPRRLRRIIFTVPTAMPVAEKRVFRRWVQWAVRVVWEALGWGQWYSLGAPNSPKNPDFRTSPAIRCDWDEASCSQLVYLYNELAVKYHGDAHQLFGILGKVRPNAPHPSVRMASVDIGGGTTDLSITTYTLTSGQGDTARLKPQLEFRDGFNIAGDDVLREIVAKHVYPALRDALVDAGLHDPSLLLGQLFGDDVIGMSQELRNIRIRFVRQIAVPVALGMLGLCEALDQVQHDSGPQKQEAAAGSHAFTCCLRDFFTPDPATLDNPPACELPASIAPLIRLAPRPQNRVRLAVEGMVNAALIAQSPNPATFTLLEVPLRVIPAAVETSIRHVLGPAIADLCEIIYRYDCDALLLTGRPSAWNGIMASVLAKLPVPPDRIIPMRHYHVGNWYPFKDVRGRIADPKTTVVVGAILCSLAEGRLEGFSFDTSALKLTSTARYIGELDNNGQLRQPKVWFTVDICSPNEFEATRAVSFGGQLTIGYRQLGVERWPTTRYHLLTFADEEAATQAAGHLPYTVHLRLHVAEVWEESKDDRDEGDFIIDSIEDAQGRAVSARQLEVRLQTLPLHEGYWLDTGTVVE
ncbi:MAG: virulence factor SrfB, partial [Desulfovibrionaceae bacterium]